jgi:hypothetical protein
VKFLAGGGTLANPDAEEVPAGEEVSPEDIERMWKESERRKAE